MHILITGGCGFIGSHLVEYHASRGDKIHVVDDLSTGSLENIAAFQDNGKVRYDHADILTWDGLERAASWADRIYHMAAVTGMTRVLSEPIKVLAINVAGTERVLRAAAATGWKPRVILASSSEVYGLNNDNARENDNLIIESAGQTRWNYAISKITDEAFGLAYARNLEIPVTSIRLFNIIGPRQNGRYGWVMPRLVEQAIKNEPITIYGDGEQTRSFCDVRDAVHALNIIADNTSCVGEVINLGSDEEISINALVELIRGKLGSNSPVRYLSYQDALGQEFIDIQKSKPNLMKFYQVTDFKFKWNLESSIDDLIASAQRVFFPPSWVQ